MAALNISFSLKIPPKSHLSIPKPHLFSSSLSPPSHLPQIELRNIKVSDDKKDGSSISNMGNSIASTSLLLLLSASLCFSNPALAFKGGGPYGQGVTRGQDLSGKDFSGKTLIKQDFKTSILRMANFKGAKLLGASFFDADLTGEKTQPLLSVSPLIEAGLEYALVRIIIRPSHLELAKTGADLSDADLRGADFSLANVTKANLTNANLEGALTTGNTSFRGSVITGADFTDVPLRDDQKEYLCKVADGVNPTTGNATRETLFCN